MRFLLSFIIVAFIIWFILTHFIGFIRNVLQKESARIENEFTNTKKNNTEEEGDF